MKIYKMHTKIKNNTYQMNKTFKFNLILKKSILKNLKSKKMEFFEFVLFPWLCLALIILGTIGNIFVFVLYSRSTLSKTSFSVYFRAIAIIDTINIWDMLGTQFVLYIFFINPQAFWCPVSRWSIIILSQMIAWLQVFVSLDRFLNITYPQRFPIFKRKTFQMSVTFAIIVYNIIVESFLLWNWYLNPGVLSYNQVLGANGTEIQLPINVTWCAYKQNAWNIHREIIFYNSVIIPFSLMLIFNVMLIVSLVRTRLRVRQRSTNSSTNSRNSIFNKRDRKFAITIIIINFIFLLMTIPNGPYNIDINLYWDYAQLLSTSHSSISFYLQLAVNSIFRDEFFKLFRRSSAAQNHRATTARPQPVATRAAVRASTSMATKSNNKPTK
jgi:hypothetical protein